MLFVIPLCFCIIFLLFVSLSILVAKFLYPILNKTCNEFNVNEKFLSCILVPFINCFPDLVNFYISFKTNSIDLALGQVVGSILIIFTLVMGSICVLQPFEILKQKSLLMNDFVSVFIVVVVFLYVLSDGRITLIECGVMVTMYVAYVIYLLYQPLYEVAEPDSTATEDGGDVPTRETDLERGVVSEFDNRLMSVPSFGIEDALSVLSDEIENNQNSDFQQSVSINYGTFDHDRDFMQDDDDTGESFRAPVKPAFQGRSSNFDGNVGGRGFGMTSEISLRSSIWNESHNYTVKNFMLGILRSVQVVFNLIDISLFVLLPYNDEQTDKPEQDDSVRETTVTDRDKTTPPTIQFG